MVLIFTQTTTCLSAEFTNLFSTEYLTFCLSRVAKETGVQLNLERRTLSGEFNSILAAHKTLENALVEYSTGAARNNLLSGTHSNVLERQTSPLDRTAGVPSLDRTYSSEKTAPEKTTFGKSGCSAEQNAVNAEYPIINQTCGTTVAPSRTLNKHPKANTSLETMKTQTVQCRSNMNSTGTDTLYTGNEEQRDKNKVTELGIDLSWIKQENESGESTTVCDDETEDNIDEETNTDDDEYLPEKEKKISKHTKKFTSVHRKPKQKKGAHKEKTDEDREYKCEICSFSSKGKNKKKNLREHIARQHRKKHTCELCDKQFGYTKDFKEHTRVHHSDLTYSCDKCEKVYRTKRIFEEHLKSHEEGYVKQLFSCADCDRTFSANFLLNAHVKAEHLGIRKTYVCATCGKVFYRRESLVMHEGYHAGIRPFVCNICGLAFSHRTSLGKHHKFKHDVNHEDSLCHFCEKKFQSPQSLQNHMKFTHSDGARTFMCSRCGKGFYQKQAMTRHERIHTGVKPFTCSLCEKSFSDTSIIRRHAILTHKWDPKKWRDCVISTGDKNY